MHKIVRLLNTVKYLKSKQILYRLFYILRKRYRKIIGFRYSFVKESTAYPLSLSPSIDYYSKCNNKEFFMLNLAKKFDSKIDWNFNGFGKLWTYNLTYFEYLKNKEDVSLIYDFIDDIKNVQDGLEPFPISLRGLNWIKFLTKYHIEDKKINDSMYAQYYILLDNLEYHLLGNHLLENGFSLLYGSYYFQDEVLYEKAKEILKKELEEQVLEDGGHFELSPMYHQLMLFRLLDCINLVKNNSFKDGELLKFLEDKSSLMLGWLEMVTFNSGEIPLLNDSSCDIAPTSDNLFEYAKRLGIIYRKSTLKDSGYRKIIKKRYECIVDIGNVGAEYIPGHTHSDTFNFELYIDDKPFIVDVGLSTYNVGTIRNLERSTKSHNTVEINGKNSSEVWGGFRVADRAKVYDVIENDDSILASHDGYKKKYDTIHTRKWDFKEDKIIIKDSLDKQTKAIARLHFHPDIAKEEVEKKIKIKNNSYNFATYKYSPKFNTNISSYMIEVSFDKNLIVELKT